MKRPLESRVGLKIMIQIPKFIQIKFLKQYKVVQQIRIWDSIRFEIRVESRIRILWAKIFNPNLESESNKKYPKPNLESRIRIFKNDIPESESRIRI